MLTNEQLVTRFYTCFGNKDYKGMQDCYAEDAVFNDAIFKNLNAAQVKAMWEMLVSKAKDLHITFSEISTSPAGAKVHWDAYYTFSATGRKVINRIDASFDIKNGKIVQHTDHFDFYTWAKQALGIKGLLLGKTGFLRKKVSDNAMQNLKRFMLSKQTG